MVIIDVERTDRFEQDVKKIKDTLLKDRIKKQICKIIDNPDVGKPLRYNLRGERTLYIKPFRLIYAVRGTRLFLLRFEHRSKVY